MFHSNSVVNFGKQNYGRGNPVFSTGYMLNVFNYVVTIIFLEIYQNNTCVGKISVYITDNCLFRVSNQILASSLKT